MRIHELKPAPGSNPSRTRIGRGQGSGKGGTSTKGHKGGQSRSGHTVKRGFEGGQTPLARRLPKFGFKNPFRVEYNLLNLEQLEHYCQKTPGLSVIDEAFYRQKRITSPSSPLVKVLGRGELKTRLTVHAHKFSDSARRAIEAAGGQVVVLGPSQDETQEGANA